MIDLEKAKQEFINYTNNYDHEDHMINLKINHSFRVMDISKEIAENLQLSEEDIELATLIGLLHDIARFEQRKKYQTFSDSKSIDHGDFGVQILEEDNYLRKYIETEEFDSIIKASIKNHNKYEIEDGLDDRQMLFAKIIRDADKIDIFYEAVELFWDENDVKNIENSYVSKMYFSQVLNKKQILRTVNATALDRVVLLISFVFDLNFEYSKKVIVDKNYINIILNRFNFKSENTILQMEEVKKKLFSVL